MDLIFIIQLSLYKYNEIKLTIFYKYVFLKFLYIYEINTIIFTKQQILTT